MADHQPETFSLSAGWEEVSDRIWSSGAKTLSYSCNVHHCSGGARGARSSKASQPCAVSHSSSTPLGQVFRHKLAHNKEIYSLPPLKQKSLFFRPSPASDVSLVMMDTSRAASMPLLGALCSLSSHSPDSPHKHQAPEVPKSYTPDVQLGQLRGKEVPTGMQRLADTLHHAIKSRQVLLKNPTQRVSENIS